MAPSSQQRLSTYTNILLALIGSVFVLIIAKQILIPLFLAGLFCLILYPFARHLERRGWHRITASLTLILISIIVILGVATLMGVLAFNFLDDLPAIKKQVGENLRYLQRHLAYFIGMHPEAFENFLSNRSDILLDNSGKYLQEIFTATTGTIMKVGLLPIYTFLFLFNRSKFKEFVLSLVPEKQKYIAHRVIQDIASVTPRYLTGLLTVVGILAVLNISAFYIIDVKYAFFLGLLAALFNFIPYLGTIIGYGIVLIFVMITQSISATLGVLICFLIAQFSEHYVFTPNITGYQVRINALATIIAIIAGGMIWGLAGMFVIMPYLAMVKIVCEHVQPLKPYAYLLGIQGTELHNINLNPFTSDDE